MSFSFWDSEFENATMGDFSSAVSSEASDTESWCALTDVLSDTVVTSVVGLICWKEVEGTMEGERGSECA